MVDDRMKRFDVLAICVLLSFLLTAAIPIATSDSPVLVGGAETYDVSVFLVGGGNLSMAPEVVPRIDLEQGDSTDFSKVLEADMLVKGQAINGGHGFILTLRVGRVGTTPAEVRVEAYNGDDRIAYGTTSVSSLSETSIPIDMLFDSGVGPDVEIPEGNRFKMRILAAIGTIFLPRDFAGNQGYGYLSLDALTIPNVSHQTLNAQGAEAASFPVFDWPTRTTNVTGVVSAAFGIQDVSSVRVVIRRGNVEVQNQLVNVSNLHYWSNWDYSGEVSGEYSYTVTVTDTQSNTYIVSGGFSIVSEGLLLTSPMQSPEGVGSINTSLELRSSLEMMVRIRNTGEATVTATLSTTASPVNVVLEGANLSSGNRVEDIPSNDFKSVSVNVTTTNLVIGDILDFEIRADTGDISASLPVSIEIIPAFGVSLRAEKTDIYVYPGEIAVFECYIKNTNQDTPDIFTISFDVPDFDDWNVTKPEDSQFSIEPLDEKSFSVVVRTPYALSSPTESFAITITARSASDSEVRAYMTIATFATQGVSISDPGQKNVDPGSSLVVDIQVNNLHEDTNTFVLSVSAPHTWRDETPTLSKPFIAVGGLSHEIVQLSIEPRLRNTPVGIHEFTVRAESRDNTTIFATQRLQVTVNGRKLYSIESVGTVFGSVAGERSKVSFDVDVANIGNVVEPLFVRCDIYYSGGQGEKMDWAIQYSGDGNETEARISPLLGKTSSLKITVEIPREVKAGNYEVEITLEDASGNRLDVEGYEDVSFLVNLKVEANPASMLGVVLQEMWIQLLLLVLVIVVGIKVSKRSEEIVEEGTEE